MPIGLANGCARSVDTPPTGGSFVGACSGSREANQVFAGEVSNASVRESGAIAAGDSDMVGIARPSNASGMAGGASGVFFPK